MAMTSYQLFIAFGMLIFGSLNSLTTSYADQQKAEGTESPSTIWGKLNDETDPVKKFDHPFYQACFMFVGEFFCMFAYLATRNRGARVVASDGGAVTIRESGALWFAIPAMCDLFGTGLMYCGLCLTYVSTFQMLRGSVVFFTAIVSHFVLKRKQAAYQWFSVLLVVAGVTVVGIVSVLAEGSSDKDTTSVIIGDCLIVFAQIITACQMCIEEKLITKYRMPALKVVGLEGFFGFCAVGLALYPMYYIRIDGFPVENVPDAVTQMKNNPVILIAMCGTAVSIAFFNFLGVTITSELSAAHRMVLDSVRTLLVWACSLVLKWEKFQPLQLLGFALLTLGTCMYNEIVPLPCFGSPSRAVAADCAGEAPEAKMGARLMHSNPHAVESGTNA